MTANKTNGGKTTTSDNLIPNIFKDAFSNLKIPGLNLEQIAEHSRANFESLLQANQVATTGLTELGKRQTEIFRQTVEQAMNVVKHSFDEVSHEERLAKQTELAKLAIEKAMTNAKDLAEIATKSGKEAADIIQKRVKASIDELQKIAGQG